MRVVTQNLWGRRGAWSDRRSVLIAGLHNLQPDLVAFQEAIKTDQYDQVSDLLGPGYHIAHQTNREPGGPGDVEAGQGISIASRWPLSGVRELDLHLTPRTADFACATLIAEIVAPDPIGKLLFVNHLPNYQPNLEHERELQTVVAARLLEELAAEGNVHVVLAGDLDAGPEAASVRFWRGLQSLDGTSVCYRDAWESRHPDEPGLTFTPRNPLVIDWDWPFRRIDYIFVRCGEHGGSTLAVSDCRVIFEEPTDGMWASDHFGVMADLVPPPSNP